MTVKTSIMRNLMYLSVAILLSVSCGNPNNAVEKESSNDDSVQTKADTVRTNPSDTINEVGYEDKSREVMDDILKDTKSLK